MFVTKRNGTQELIKFDKITTRIKKLITPGKEKYIGGGESPTFITSNSKEESKIKFYFLLCQLRKIKY